MATIRIPLAQQALEGENPNMGQVRARLTPALRDPRAGTMNPNAGQRDVMAGQVDVQTAGAPGRALMQAGAALGQMAEAERRMQDDLQRRRAATELARRANALEEEFQSGPVRTREEVVRDFTARMGEAVTELGRDMSPRAREIWQAEAEQLTATRGFSVGRAAFQRQAQAAVAGLQDSTREAANLAAQARNPAERALHLERGDAEIEAAVDAGYVNPEAAGRLRRGFRQDVQMADVTRLMAADPTAAIRLLNDVAATPDLDADRRAALVNQALNRRDAMAARAEAATARAEAQVGRAVQQFDGLLNQGIVPEGRADEVLAMARGTAMEPVVRQLIDDARLVQSFATASLPDQQRMLAEAEARMRAPNATDVDLRNFQRLATVQQNQLRGYQQDGLGQAVREGLVEPQPPINWADPTTLNSRVAAAEGLSLRRGYGISPFNRQDLDEAVRQFTTANPDARLAIVQAVADIQDPAVRAAAFQHLERARGDAGRMPAGTLVRVADMLRSGSVEAQQAARRIVGNLAADVSDRARQAGESAEIRAAVVSAQATGVQGVRMRAAAVAGGGPFAALVSRDMDVIQRDAAVRMTTGESATAAVRSAQRDWNTGLAVVDDGSLAHVYFPGDRATPAQVTTGLRALRTEAAAVTLDPAAGAQANLEARAAARAASNAIWINEGDRFALVARGQGGAPVVLREATLEQVLGTTRANEAARAATPPSQQSPVTRRQIEEGQRQSRQMRELTGGAGAMPETR